jgi:hypothetical protein
MTVAAPVLDDCAFGKLQPLFEVLPVSCGEEAAEAALTAVHQREVWW